MKFDPKIEARHTVLLARLGRRSRGSFKIWSELLPMRPELSKEEESYDITYYRRRQRHLRACSPITAE
jgi:hypothetical protein